ncbi:MAG: hypothetical protein KDB90_14990 [Planctomycetes bacterium]|nr:hypothetical protein [Planctomycetota bacterium]
MKYALAFIASFALVAATTAFVRVQAGEAPIADAAPQHHQDDAKEHPKKDDGHDGHDMGDKKDEGHDAHGNDGDKKEEKKEESEWDGEVKTDLKNETDPVSGDKIGEDAKHSVVYHGFKVHFSEDKSIAKFKRRPIQYCAALGLERTTEGEIKKVDPDEFKDPPTIAATCPIMGGDIVKEDGTYILHRGYRIYFCCWNGCWEKFLKEPSKYYGEYGLEEKDGKLQPKAE